MRSSMIKKPIIGLLCAVMFAGVLVACTHNNACASTLGTESIVYTKIGGSSSSSSSHSSSSSSSSHSSSSPKSVAPSSNGSRTSAGSSSSKASTSKTPTSASKTVAPTNNGSRTGVNSKTVAPSVNGSRVGSKTNPVPSGSRPANNVVPKTNYSVSIGGVTHVYVVHPSNFYGHEVYVSSNPIFFNDPYDPHNFSNLLSPWYGIRPHYIASSCY